MAPKDLKTTVPVSSRDVAREVERMNVDRASIALGGGKGVAYQVHLRAADISDPDLGAQLKEQIDAESLGRNPPEFVSKGLELAVPALDALAKSRGEKGPRELEILHHIDGKIQLGVRDGETSHHATVIEGPAAPLEN